MSDGDGNDEDDDDVATTDSDLPVPAALIQTSEDAGMTNSESISDEKQEGVKPLKTKKV